MHAKRALLMAKRILIIEDDPKSLYALSTVLTDHGHDVVPCASAEEAVGVSCANLDVAIVDVRLPEIQGTDFARGLRSKCPHTKIIFITAYNGISDIAKTVSNSSVLTKPLDMDRLFTML
jgi:CheY-like chemotaxis protein